MVVRTIDWEYMNKNNSVKGFKLSPLVVSSLDLYCARPQNSSVTLIELNKALGRLSKARTMEKILDKYR